MTETVHQLKITLRRVEPTVWRRVAVNSEVTLGELSPVFAAAMGWLDYHLHQFDIGGKLYGIPDIDPPPEEQDENLYHLGDVLPDEGSEMRWDYDFGDGWKHDVLVERIDPADPDVEYPVCLAGERACPPEDCGGPLGYENLLSVLADSTHPDHEFLKEWAPADLDPAHFDIDAANLAVRERSLQQRR